MHDSILLDSLMVVYSYYKVITIFLQGGPQPDINRIIAPISRVITPVAHLFSAIYKGRIVLGPPLYPGCLEAGVFSRHPWKRTKLQGGSVGGLMAW